MAKAGEFRETDIYKPVHDYLTNQGYIVRSEVKDCDVTAIKGEELVVVELKKSLNLELLLQATQRQKVADSVYVAVPKPQKGVYSNNWKNLFHLLRRLELGLIFVAIERGSAGVEIAFHPSAFDRLKSKQNGKKQRKGIIREIEGRYGDFNQGGSCRTKLVTAYRENSVHIACCLDRLGAMSPKQLRSLGTVDKTLSILSKNYYNWFENTERGIYALNQKGKAELSLFQSLADYYYNKIKEQIKE